MNAAEIIKLVAELSPEERVRFQHLLRALEDGTPPATPVTRLPWTDFGDRLREIYGDKVSSDSQVLIDEGRGSR